MKLSQKQDIEVMEKNADILYERRNMLDSARMKHSDSLDKYLLTFSTGSLYLSINFTREIVGKPCSEWQLAVGWVFLLTSIISILTSFYCGEKAHVKQIEINDQYIKALYNKKLKINDLNKWNSTIEAFKITSISSFILGILFLTYFYFINL